MSNRRPSNPIISTWRWLGFWGNHLSPYVTAFSAVLLAGGGALAGRDWGWWFAIVAGALLPMPGFFWRRKMTRDGDLSDGRERLLDETLPAVLEQAMELPYMKYGELSQMSISVSQRIANDLRNAFADVSGVRVVVFRMSDDGKKMEPLRPAGRTDKPHPFVLGTTRGNKAFAVLSGEKPFVHVNDLSKEKPGEWAGTGQGYSTFITAPIRSKDSGYGLLTIDAPLPGALEEQLGVTLALFASTLGVFFAEESRPRGFRR